MDGSLDGPSPAGYDLALALPCARASAVWWSGLGAARESRSRAADRTDAVAADLEAVRVREHPGKKSRRRRRYYLYCSE